MNKCLHRQYRIDTFIQALEDQGVTSSFFEAASDPLVAYEIVCLVDRVVNNGNKRQDTPMLSLKKGKKVSKRKRGIA
jgi:hypothetical protein